MKVKTVVIETENGPVVINESDFNEDEHSFFEDVTHEEIESTKETEKPTTKKKDKKKKK